MTDREAMQTALEALNLPSLKTQQMLQQRDAAIATLRAQLEQQAEPVAYCYVKKGSSADALTFDPNPANAVSDTVFPLYAAPPQRKWSSLTDDEIKEIVGPWGDMPIKGYTRELFDRIDEALRRKNT